MRRVACLALKVTSMQRVAYPYASILTWCATLLADISLQYEHVHCVIKIMSAIHVIEHAMYA